ncbi:AAA domain-containing protein [Gordonia sp. TBRC 11910]|uniref:AAA domain-containing protein n=2 Tax=Gordonia asplenii TaxID=2725283 RepID=A0A848KSC4_9ACTN|nr:AAA domain-containing protein [Gordonia asplenii]
MIWTEDNLAELNRDFVQRPDIGGGTFFDKLAGQLADSSPDAIQLFAELYTMNVLPIVNLSGPLKIEQANTILALSERPVHLPADVEHALSSGGVYHGGQAFNNYRWKQINYLIEFAQVFRALPSERRMGLLDDPLEFRALAQSVETGQIAQRQSLLYLAFPDFFLPIVSINQRRQIRDAFATDYLSHSTTDDVDVDLHTIYDNLVEAHGGPVDFYVSPWVEKWKDPAPTAEPTDDVTHAWKVYGSNVAGIDMVPIWRRKGSVSLAAKFLRQLDSELTQDELRAIVAEDYRSSPYTIRQEKTHELYTFLSRIHPGDLVVTVSQGRAYFGTVTGEAEQIASSDGRSNLRRSVTWETHNVPSVNLPMEISAVLTTGGDVVDITEQIDTIRELMGQREDSPPATKLNLRDADAELAEQLNVPQAWLQECVELLRDRPQLIFYGPPGTGKTYLAKALAHYLAGENVKLVQFHPAYSYEDFFEGYRPAQGSGGQVGFELRPGPLRRIVDKANENPSAAYVLIIDEINRGNLAKIFGELYFLLEYRSEGIDLLYGSDDGKPFVLPRNVILLGTMNTADRSIALVDAAMRRRFAFLPLHPSEEPTNKVLRRWLHEKGHSPHVADLLDELNKRIPDDDFKIGPSYFMRESVFAPGGLDRAWRTSILPLLEEFHYGDPGVDVRADYGLAAIEKKFAASSAGNDDDTYLPD